MPNWNDYQEEVASFFREIGLEAQTNVPLRGVRTSHDIDVVVRAKHVGFDMLWIVECKHWSNPVSKLHVLALREIVSDLGADRGLLMAENGYQKGAYEAAELTNVQLTSLLEVRNSAGYTVGMANLRTLQARVDECRERYWSLEKLTRIDHDLRPDVGFDGYSGTHVLEAAENALNSAFKGRFPIAYDSLLARFYPEYWAQAETPLDLFEKLTPIVQELENRLDRAYGAIRDSQP